MAAAEAAAAALCDIFRRCCSPCPSKVSGTKLAHVSSQLFSYIAIQLSRAGSREHARRGNGSVGRRLKRRVCFLSTSDIHRINTGFFILVTYYTVEVDGSCMHHSSALKSTDDPGHPYPVLLTPHERTEDRRHGEKSHTGEQNIIGNASQ